MRPVREIQSTASTPISLLHEPASRRAPITMPRAKGISGMTMACQMLMPTSGVRHTKPVAAPKAEYTSQEPSSACHSWSV